MSTLRTTNVQHGSSSVTNIQLDNQGRAIFGPDGPNGRASLYVNAQTNRVGVNNESPNVALDVDGAINSTGNTTLGGTLEVTGITTLTNDLVVDTNTLFVDVSTNKVGIRNTSMGSLYGSGSDLVVGPGNASGGITVYTSTNGQGIIAYADGFTGGAQQYAGYLLYDHTTDSFRIATTGVERLRLTSSGSLGINSQDPADVLEVKGNIRLKPPSGVETRLNFEYNNDVFAYIRGEGRNGSPLYGDLEFFTKGSTDSEPQVRLIVTADGDVGINYQPSDLLVLRQGSDDSLLKFRPASDFYTGAVGHAVDSRDLTNANSTDLIFRGNPIHFWTTAEKLRLTGQQLLLAPTMGEVVNSDALFNIYAPNSGDQIYKAIEIGSNVSNNASTGAVIAGRSYNNTHKPYVLLGGWDAGETTGTNDVYLGGGWGTAARAATKVRMFTSTYQTTSPASGTERFEINQTGKLVVGPNVTRIRKTNSAIEYPLEVTSTNNSLDGGGIWTNNGFGVYGMYSGGGADNSSTCAVQFQVVSSITQSYPIRIYTIVVGCNTSTTSPSPVCGWRLYKARVYNGTIDNISLVDSGGDGVTTSIVQMNQLNYNGVTNGACQFKVYSNSGRAETTMYVWLDYRLATIRADRLSG